MSPETSAGEAGEPEISVVIPAFNEEARISATLARTAEYLGLHHRRSEILVVDDGSDDDTAAIVEGFAERDPRVRLLRLDRNRGKGAAVRRGMLEALGAHVLFMDADMSTPVEEIEKVLHYARRGFDVVIGSRGLPDSDVRTHQPFYREAMGRCFNGLIRFVLMGGIRDTQCGFKLFSRAAARDLFGAQQLDGFAFDVEVLHLAREKGYRIREVPVIWYHAPHSKVSPVTDASRMFLDLLRIRFGGRRKGPGAAP